MEKYLGEQIPKLGFGLMRLPLKKDTIDLEQTKEMADLFLKEGFCYFDTAYGYLDGKSEKAVKEVLEKNNVAQEEISFYILHQANKRIVEAVAKRLRTDIGKFPMNLEEYGNTSSASIPILLDEMNRAGKLKKGQKIILSGFGAGLSWGASLIEW